MFVRWTALISSATRRTSLSRSSTRVKHCGHRSLRKQSATWRRRAARGSTFEEEKCTCCRKNVQRGSPAKNILVARFGTHSHGPAFPTKAKQNLIYKQYSSTNFEVSSTTTKNSTNKRYCIQFTKNGLQERVNSGIKYSIKY